MNTPQIELILATLEREQVAYIMIGGWAVIAHGSGYITRDTDLCYQRTPENIQRLVRAVEPLHPYLRGAPPDLPFRFDARTIESGLNFTLTTDAGDLDLLGEVAGLGTFERAAIFSEQMELFGFPVRVLSLDGLVRSKKAAGRPKDLLILPELEALLALKNRIVNHKS